MDIGTTAQIVTATIMNLSYGDLYHCQVVASNSVGVTYGGDASFNTD